MNITNMSEEIKKDDTTEKTDVVAETTEVEN